jgi:hypothetical protein
MHLVNLIHFTQKIIGRFKHMAFPFFIFRESHHGRRRTPPSRVGPVWRPGGNPNTRRRRASPPLPPPSPPPEGVAGRSEPAPARHSRSLAHEGGRVEHPPVRPWRDRRVPRRPAHGLVSLPPRDGRRCGGGTSWMSTASVSLGGVGWAVLDCLCSSGWRRRRGGRWSAVL